MLAEKLLLRANKHNETQQVINTIEYVRRRLNVSPAAIIEPLQDIDHSGNKPLQQ